jgi:hypothetical protein
MAAPRIGGQGGYVHQELADVALIPAGRQFVEQLVAERTVFGGEAGE